MSVCDLELQYDVSAVFPIIQRHVRIIFLDSAHTLLNCNENLKIRDYLGDYGFDGRTVLNYTMKIVEDARLLTSLLTRDAGRDVVNTVMNILFDVVIIVCVELQLL